MKTTTARWGGVPWVLGVAALLSLAWYVFLSVTGIRADLGETNFQSNLIRATDYFHGADKPVAVIGTSITGRLLPRYFLKYGVAVSNLGFDGCSDRTGIEIALRKSKPPGTILIEPMPSREKSQNDFETLAAIDSFTFKLSRYLPIVRPSARPSALLYTAMKRRNDNRTAAQAFSAGPASQAEGAPVKEDESETERRGELEIEHDLSLLQQRGCRIVLMRLPVSTPNPQSYIDRISAKLSIPILDVGRIMKERNITPAFSDGVHMVGPTAREAAGIICEWLKANPQ